MTSGELKAWRERRNLTATEAALFVAVALQRWLDYESGKRKIPRDMVRALEIHDSNNEPPTGPPAPHHGPPMR